MAHKYKATAIREGRRYLGSFWAEDENQARTRLQAQGYQVLSLEVVSEKALYIWMGLALAATLLFFSVVFFQLTADKKDISNKRSGKILNQWTRLKGGGYFIATGRVPLERAMRLRESGSKTELKKMLASKEVGTTNQFGGGLPVYIAEWDQSRHVAQIKFKDNPTICWVEDRAVLG